MRKDQMQLATFGAGCYWCVEAVFSELDGVHSVDSGYMGVKTSNPTCREVCSCTSGHAEVVQMTFEPDEISFVEFLHFFWSTLEPTTLNRQGHDRSTQYRSVIFYDPDQKETIAEKSRSEVTSRRRGDPVVTEISPAFTFYMAEPYHQDYYENNPNQGYCRAIIQPEVLKFRRHFIERLKQNSTNA